MVVKEPVKVTLIVVKVVTKLSLSKMLDFIVKVIKLITAYERASSVLEILI